MATNCTEQVKVHGVVFSCSGVHGPRAITHRVVVMDSTGTRHVFVEWKVRAAMKQEQSS